MIHDCFRFFCFVFFFFLSIIPCLLSSVVAAAALCTRVLQLRCLAWPLALADAYAAHAAQSMSAHEELSDEGACPLVGGQFRLATVWIVVAAI